MWVPSEDEAIEMFARHFEPLHRSGTATRAEERAAELVQTAGDRKGHAIWQKVVERIQELGHSSRVMQRRGREADWPPSA